MTNTNNVNRHDDILQSASPLVCSEAPRELNDSSEWLDQHPGRELPRPKAISTSLKIESTKKELEDKLLVELSALNHIIGGFFAVFNQKFDELFNKHMIVRSNLDWTVDDEEILIKATTLVRSFVALSKWFIGWVYEEFIVKFKNTVNGQDLNPSSIVESVLYQLLFKDEKTFVNKFLRDLLSTKYASKIQRLQQKMIEADSLELKDFELSLGDSSLFLMEKDDQPYKKIIDRIKAIQPNKSPYDNAENILSLETEIINLLLEYHGNTENMRKAIGEVFGMDVKTPLMLYCILKSKNINVIVANALIEEFVVNYEDLQERQDFMAFFSYIEYLTERKAENRKLSSFIEMKCNSVLTC